MVKFEVYVTNGEDVYQWRQKLLTHLSFVVDGRVHKPKVKLQKGVVVVNGKFDDDSDINVEEIIDELEDYGWKATQERPIVEVKKVTKKKTDADVTRENTRQEQITKSNKRKKRAPKKKQKLLSSEELVNVLTRLVTDNAQVYMHFGHLANAFMNATDQSWNKTYKKTHGSLLTFIQRNADTFLIVEAPNNDPQLRKVWMKDLYELKQEEARKRIEQSQIKHYTKPKTPKTRKKRASSGCFGCLFMMYVLMASLITTTSVLLYLLNGGLKNKTINGWLKIYPTIEESMNSLQQTYNKRTQPYISDFVRTTIGPIVTQFMPQSWLNHYTPRNENE